jgi:hypothetical protein
VSAEDDASLHGIRQLRQTLAKLTARLNASSAVLMPILTRWQPLRINQQPANRTVADTREPATGRTRAGARSALFASAAAARVPLAVNAPESVPILAYDLLAERITEMMAR